MQNILPSIGPKLDEFMDAFHDFARFGRLHTHGGRISSSNLKKWLKQSGIIPTHLTPALYDVKFSEFAGKMRSLSIEETIGFSKILADFTGNSIGMFLTTMVTCGSPLSTDTTVVSRPRTVDKMSSPVSVVRRREDGLARSSRTKNLSTDCNWPQHLVKDYKKEMDQLCLQQRHMIKKQLDSYRTGVQKRKTNTSLENQSVISGLVRLPITVSHPHIRTVNVDHLLPSGPSPTSSFRSPGSRATDWNPKTYRVSSSNRKSCTMSLLQLAKMRYVRQKSCKVTTTVNALKQY